MHTQSEKRKIYPHSKISTLTVKSSISFDLSWEETLRRYRALLIYLFALAVTPPSSSNSFRAWQNASMAWVGGVNRNWPVFSSPSYWSYRSRLKLREFPVYNKQNSINVKYMQLYKIFQCFDASFQYLKLNYITCSLWQSKSYPVISF